VSFSATSSPFNVDGLRFEFHKEEGQSSTTQYIRYTFKRRSWKRCGRHISWPIMSMRCVLSSCLHIMKSSPLSSFSITANDRCFLLYFELIQLWRHLLLCCCSSFLSRLELCIWRTSNLNMWCELKALKYLNCTCWIHNKYILTNSNPKHKTIFHYAKVLVWFHFVNIFHGYLISMEVWNICICKRTNFQYFSILTNVTHENGARDVHPK